MPSAMGHHRLFYIDAKLVRDQLNAAIIEAEQIHRLESALVQRLYRLDHRRFYVRYGCNSLHRFCVRSLKFTRTQAQRIVTQVRRYDPDTCPSAPTVLKDVMSMWLHVDFATQAAERVLRLAQKLNVKKQTLSFAESCTGGLLSASVAREAGISSFYQGGVVSYARAVKEDVLGVPSQLLKEHGEVHTETARAMAQGAARALKSDWAVAVTGIAGPSGGSPEKPVGFVCFAVVGPNVDKAVEQRFGRGSRQDIQQQSVLFAIDLLLNEL